MSLEESRAAHLVDGEQVYATIIETFLAGLVADASAAAAAPLRSRRGPATGQAAAAQRTRTTAGKRAARA
jgi:hypothetical protein